MDTDKKLSRNERQRRLNMQLSILPLFTPLNPYDIYHINRSTSPMLLHDLIGLARKTTKFTIDTEFDYYTHQPALIQIEFIEKQSTVLLIETNHLPNKSSVLFWLIKSLLKMIFIRSNTIYAWGDGIQELTHFLHYDLFSSNTLKQIKLIDIQYHFKQWYNNTFEHHCGLQSLQDDYISCTCSYRPIKNKNDTWSLQKAIAYTFCEFLDKSRTKSNWSRRLDLHSTRQFLHMNQKQENLCEEMIKYAVNDCLAVTKLVMVVESKWTKEQLRLYNLHK